MNITRPLLAATLESLDQVRFPVMASPKLDGIRALKVGGKLLSRSFKEIPNRYIQKTLADLPDGFDGELVLKGYPKDCTFQEVTSAVMSREGKPDFEYWVFDFATAVNAAAPGFRYRFASAKRRAEAEWVDGVPIRVVEHRLLINRDELELFEVTCLRKGYEGVMLRDPDGRYKCGRSTLKEGILLKLKRFEDAEAVIVGFVEQRANTNKQEVSELGLSKRSHKKEGMVGKDTLGALDVADLKTGKPFQIGTGFTDNQRLEIWNHRSKYKGKIVCYKYQVCGMKDKPRIPVFKGFRAEEDM